jgi:hypothetical protein
MLYKAKIDKDPDIFKKCRVIGDFKPLGYEKIQDFFVDNSGCRTESEPALTMNSFLNKVKAGLYYAITACGQFQVYIGEFKKIAKTRKQIFAEQGISSSKLISKSCRIINYINGDKTIRLYSTDILQFEGDKIILNSGGYRTNLTKNRINENLPVGITVYQKDFQWYVNFKGQEIKFEDNLELTRI